MPLPETERLLEIIHTLRAPGGCPWDRKQTLVSAARYTVDEAAELLEAALAEDDAAATEELGDLLFMTAFCREILGERTGRSFDDVAGLAADKLVRRHPHVFGDASAADQAESQEHWNAVKAAEKRARGEDPDQECLLKDLPASASPLRQAYQHQKDAARAGFDWPDAAGVWDKVAEELAELRRAAETGDPAAVRHEVGDVLLAVVNLARKLDVEADDALRLANRRFRERFRSVAARFGRDPEAMRRAGLDALEAAWQAAKREPGAAG